MARYRIPSSRRAPAVIAIATSVWLAGCAASNPGLQCRTERASAPSRVVERDLTVPAADLPAATPVQRPDRRTSAC